MKMRTTVKLPLPGWRWVIFAVAVGVALALSFPTLAQINGSKWTVSTNSIDEVSFDSSGIMWTKPSQPRILSLNPSNNTLTTWTLDNTSIFGNNAFGMIAVQQVDTDIDRYVWSTGTNLDHVNRMDTTNGEVISWPLPASTTCSRYNLAVDAAGNAWVGKSDERVARIDPITDTITEWPMPTAGNYCPRVIGVDGNGDIWICEAEIDKIGVLDPDTNMVTEWTISGNNFNDCHGRDDAGPIWFSRNSKEILRLDPSTDQLTIFDCPIGCSNVSGVSKESGGKVWFVEGRVINSFDRVAGEFVEYTGTGCSELTPYVDPTGDVWTTFGATTVCSFTP